MRNLIDAFCFHAFGHSIIAIAFGSDSLAGVGLGIVVALIGPPGPDDVKLG